MRRIFLAKHWQIVLILLIPSFVAGLFGGLSELLDAIFYIASIAFYVGWLLLMGRWLKKVSPTPVMNYSVFVVTGWSLIIVIVGVRIFALSKAESAEILKSAYILFPMTYSLIAIIVLTSFVGKNLRVIEVGREVDVNDYINDILSLIFWPIGIWMFQPRINRIERRIAMQKSGVSQNNDNFLTKATIKVRGPMHKAIYRLVGYGILIFIMGYIVGVYWIKWIQLLMPVGSLMTFIGVFYFFRDTDLKAEFAMNPKEHALAYFWNVIVLKFWTLWFVIFMITMNLKLIKGDWIL